MNSNGTSNGHASNGHAVVPVRPIAARSTVMKEEAAMAVGVKVMELQRQGKEIIRFDLGDSDFDTPDHITKACIDALNDKRTHYTSPKGTVDARQAAARYFSRTRKVDVGFESCFLTPGGKAAIFAAIQLVCEAGDEVIVPSPGFPQYTALTEYSGAKVVPLVLNEASGWTIEVDTIKKLITPRTKMVILNYPSNPTGSTLSAENLKTVAELSKQHGFWVLADEVYGLLTPDSEFDSIYSVPGMADRTIVIESVSKTHAMTGWRLGFMVVPPVLQQPLNVFAVNSWTCLPEFCQLSFITAVEGDQTATQSMAKSYQERANIMVTLLETIPGIKCRVPNGSIYCFPDIRGTGMSSVEFAEYCLNEASVSVVAGSFFGEAGEGFIRIALASGEEKLRQGALEIKKALEKRSSPCTSPNLG